MEAADDEPVAGRVRQREGEALVATGVFERVEPDEPDALDRPAAARLEDRGACRQLIELPPDGPDLLEVRVEDAIERLALPSSGQDRHAPADTAQLASHDEDEHEEDEDGEAEAEEEARAAELEAAILAEQDVADERLRLRERAARPTGRPPADPAARVSYSSVPLGVRAAEEYGYVRRDIRRITIVGGSLLLILAILEVLVNGMHLFTL